MGEFKKIMKLQHKKSKEMLILRKQIDMALKKNDLSSTMRLFGMKLGVIETISSLEKQGRVAKAQQKNVRKKYLQSPANELPYNCYK